MWEKIQALINSLAVRFNGIENALAKVTTAEERVKALEAQLDTANQANATLTADLEKAQGEVNAKGTELKALAEQLDAAKAKANEVIAGQGLDPAAVPASETGTTTVTAGSETAWQKYNRLRAENTRAAGEFYAANAEAIFNSRPKQS